MINKSWMLLFGVLPFFSTVPLWVGLPLVFFAVGLSHYDLTVRRLPNQGVLGLALVGLVLHFIQLTVGAVSVTDALKATGYQLLVALLVLFVIFTLINLYSHWRGRQMMGMGDVKYMAAALCWFDVFYFPIFLWLAAILGLIITFIQWVIKNKSFKEGMKDPIAFGPYLALSHVMVVLFIAS